MNRKEINIKKGVKGFITGKPSWNYGRKMLKGTKRKLLKAQSAYQKNVRNALEIQKNWNNILSVKPMELNIGNEAYVKKSEILEPSSNKPWLLYGVIGGLIIGIIITVVGFYMARYTHPWQIYTVLYSKQVVGNWTQAQAVAWTNGTCTGVYRHFNLPDVYNGLNISLNNTISYDCYINGTGPIILKKGYIRG